MSINTMGTNHVPDEFSFSATESLPRLFMYFRNTFSRKYLPCIRVLTVLVHRKVKEELSKVFDLDRYLQIRSTASLLSLYDPGSVTAPLREIMTVDAGGWMDCMGNLREDGLHNCASCGRPSCEYIEMYAFL